MEETWTESDGPCPGGGLIQAQPSEKHCFCTSVSKEGYESCCLCNVRRKLRSAAKRSAREGLARKL